MRIAHLCLSNWYIDGLAYQENELIRQHVSDGHEVLVLASTEVQKQGRLEYTSPGSFTGPEGAKVIRLPYRSLPRKLAAKARSYPGVYEHLSAFRPDAILFHGTCAWEVMTAARYARENPDVLFYIDSHEDHYNSARNFISREILHRRFYRYCLQRALPAARKVLCVSTETMDFCERTYDVPRGQLEFYPLGGRPISDVEYTERRRRGRSALGVAADDIVFVQSGKQTVRKKLIESLEAFSKAAPPNAKLFIIGSIADDIREPAMKLLDATPNAQFIGWKSPEEVTDILCACDVYLQPGTQSVTMQNSLCCRCAVILDDVPSHSVYVKGNGWLINDRVSLERAISECGTADLAAKGAASYEIATTMLDYELLSKRILHR